MLFSASIIAALLAGVSEFAIVKLLLLITISLIRRQRVMRYQSSLIKHLSTAKAAVSAVTAALLKQTVLLLKLRTQQNSAETNGFIQEKLFPVKS